MTHLLVVQTMNYLMEEKEAREGELECREEQLKERCAELSELKKEYVNDRYKY